MTDVAELGAASDSSFDSTFDFAYDVPEFHDELARLRRDKPVALVPFHGGAAYLLTRHADVEEAFRDEATFPAQAAYTLHSEPVMGRTLQCMTGDEHTRNRALVSPAFRARLMPGYVEPILAPVAHELVDRVAGRGEADLVAEFTREFPFTVITRLLGIPPRNEGDIQRWALALLSYPWDPEAALEVRTLFTAIAGLPDDFRDVIVAVDVLGLSYAEAAKAVGAKEATVTTRLHRARTRLAQDVDRTTVTG